VWEGKAQHYNSKAVKYSIGVDGARGLAAARKVADVRCVPRRKNIVDVRCVPHRKKILKSPCARRNTVQKYSLIPYQPRQTC
jgi:hypothetical protein